jgi:(1->4)-alpha-D-glucan 1-alpha-D-glucosylmutase
MYNPVSTYRLQLNDSFNLAAVQQILPYLHDLGISTLYAAPIFEATPGSNHGYDGVDPARIAPALGTREQLAILTQQFRKAGIGWLQDIVPNHMAYHQHNTWLVDLLEMGSRSRYKDFFDVTYTSDVYHERIMAPFLGDSLGKALENGELAVIYDRDRLFLKYHDNEFPLRPSSYLTVLMSDGETLDQATQQWLQQVKQLRPIEDPEYLALAWDECLKQLTAITKSDSGQQWLQQAISEINNKPELLKTLADEQHYRLCAWTEGMQKINYRRFFTVNGLICLSMQNRRVFEQYHDLIKQLVDEGVFQGIRVDHIDGLYDPEGYLTQLRKLTGPETYIVVEKIQQANELLPAKWTMIQGTSGYDFLALVNNLLTDPLGEQPFTSYFESIVRSQTPVNKRIRDRKAYILYQHMGGELNNLADHFYELKLDEIERGGQAEAVLRLAIAEILVYCPVYRYYGNQTPLPDEDAQALRSMMAAIREEKPDLAEGLDRLENALLLKPPVADIDYRDRARRFYQRLMQFTGPLMAKGVEDTLMYTYNRFIGHNEVGDSPARFGLPVSAFHQAMQERQRLLPLSMNGLSTHDTKRGEDARARLNVLTALPGEWLTEVQCWQNLNADLKVDNAPDVNDEYFLYQSLVGGYTMPQGSGAEAFVPNPAADDFAQRFDSFVQKALHESKRHVSEVRGPHDERYVEATRTFAQRLLDQKRPFWSRFEAFVKRVADFGITNSLVQVVLKNTCPGVPDLYQGAESWDFSFVDPDNRRLVDFEKRKGWLRQFMTQTPDLTELWHDRFSGRVKLFVTHKLLQFRKANPDLFWQGDYVPLTVEGVQADHVLACARHYQDQWAVVVVSLFSARLCREQKVCDVAQIDWYDTRILLPEGRRWMNLWTNEPVKSGSLNELFSGLPVAVLV